MNNKLLCLILPLLTLTACAPSQPLFGSSAKPWDATEFKAKQLENAHYIAEETGATKDNKKQVSYNVTSAKDCKAKRTVHNSVNYLPVVGPFFDLSTIPNREELAWWEAPLSSALPFIGPSIVSSVGSQVCVH